MTFDFEIQKCEHCGKEYLVEVMSSWNTFGMRLRSDGRKLGGGMIEPKAVFKCYGCFNVSWVKSETIKIGDRAIKKLNFLPSVSIELCEEIILNKLYYNLETETYIRMKYWHLCNDKSNKKQFELDKGNKILIDNLRDLLNIFKEDTSIDSQLLRCEILRELGLFKEAKDVLLKIKFLDGNPVINVFEKLINDEDDKIQTINGYPDVPVPCEADLKEVIETLDMIVSTAKKEVIDFDLDKLRIEKGWNE